MDSGFPYWKQLNPAWFRYQTAHALWIAWIHCGRRKSGTPLSCSALAAIPGLRYLEIEDFQAYFQTVLHDTAFLVFLAGMGRLQGLGGVRASSFPFHAVVARPSMLRRKQQEKQNSLLRSLTQQIGFRINLAMLRPASRIIDKPQLSNWKRLVLFTNWSPLNEASSNCWRPLSL